MILNDQKAKERINEPKASNYLRSVRLYESALRVFTEELDVTELNDEPYWTTLQDKMFELTARKYGRIKQFVRYPLPVVQITDSILNDYFKVFEGKNRFFNVDANRDIDALRQWINNEKPQTWIENEARSVFKNKPCSVVVIDRDEKGTPYLLNIDSERLVDAIVKEDGSLEYVIFVHSIETNPNDETEQLIYYAVYDDNDYRVISKSTKYGKLTEVKKVIHGLGYCPAKMFITSKSNGKNPFKRRVAFGSAKSKLEDWTIFDIFRNYTDHYVPFPVTEAPKKKCANNGCRDGKVSEEEIIDKIKGTKRTKWSTCPVCEGKDPSSLIGPGTHIGIKLQADKTKEDGSGKFKMHFPETDKIKYIPEKLDDLELEIRYKTVGVSDVLTNEAVNELQVKGSFTSMESILMRNKLELDILYKWIIKTVSQLFYKNVDIQIEANFGTEWYLVSEENLQKVFDNAKKIGLPKSEQILIYEQLIDTKYKGNTSKIERQKLLLSLDPLPLYSEEEAIEMYEKQAISERVLNLKINFYTFVSRFEMENMVITEFGTNLEHHEKIKIINNTLNIYNDENIRSKQSESSDDSTEID